MTSRGADRIGFPMGGNRTGRLSGARYGLLLVAIFLVAAVLRILAALPFVVEHPDEVLQYLEPAYHVVTRGPWTQTWEQREGMRSWLLPGLIAGPMWLGKAVAPGGTLYLLLPRLTFAGCSLLLVAAAIRIGSLASRRHALAAGAASAIWFELIYLAPRLLSENLATVAALLGTAVLLKPVARLERASDVVAGALLGLGFVLRIQYGPALAVLVIAAVGRRDARRYLAVIAGGLIPLALDAAVALAAGQVPFAWIVRNVMLNVIEGRSASFGTSPPWQYVLTINRRWWLAAVPLLILAWLGARRAPALAAMALANVVVHSAIPHKEWRFIFLTVASVVILAALGSVELWSRSEARHRRLVAGLLIGGWLGATALLPRPRPVALIQQTELEVVRYAARVAPSCAVGIYDFPYLNVGAHVLAGRPVAFAVYDDEATAAAALSRDAPALGSVITFPKDLPAFGTAFPERRCFDDPNLGPTCVAKRQGACTGGIDPRNAIQARMEASGV
jgi:hypothetical protein